MAAPIAPNVAAQYALGPQVGGEAWRVPEREHEGWDVYNEEVSESEEGLGDSEGDEWEGDTQQGEEGESEERPPGVCPSPTPCSGVQ